MVPARLRRACRLPCGCCQGASILPGVPIGPNPADCIPKARRASSPEGPHSPRHHGFAITRRWVNPALEYSNCSPGLVDRGPGEHDFSDALALFNRRLRADHHQLQAIHRRKARRHRRNRPPGATTSAVSVTVRDSPDASCPSGPAVLADRRPPTSACPVVRAGRSAIRSSPSYTSPDEGSSARP